MILYLKTTFDSQKRKFKVDKIVFRYGNDSEINQIDYPCFKDIDKFGILDLKIHPLEAKRWFDSLSSETKDQNYVIFWDGGWISIPWEMVEILSME